MSRILGAVVESKNNTQAFSFEAGDEGMGAKIRPFSATI